MSRVRRLAAQLLRRAGVLSLAERLEARRVVARAAPANAAFRAREPGFAAPPPAFLYEAHGHARLDQYARSGRQAAEALAALARAHLEAPLRTVLDWGAGPARVVRWWPELAPGVSATAADPWRAAMDWGASHIPDVTFQHVAPTPPTPFSPDAFDLVYGISILTHLPRDDQRAWMAELGRVTRPGGLIALTVHGARAAAALAPAERAAWERGELVVRGRVKVGSRLYAAYHPPAFLRDTLFAAFEVITHEPDSAVAGGGQDLWLLRRPPERAPLPSAPGAP